jgi:hypothetical protein
MVAVLVENPEDQNTQHKSKDAEDSFAFPTLDGVVIECPTFPVSIYCVHLPL